jgi:hypothetical protein
MYENGGNTVHRFLDGHPELYVYPFESQLGNRLVVDHLSSMFPFKYRWPEFMVQGNPDEDYALFYDEELKVRVRTPLVSKFRDADFQMQESERTQAFVDCLRGRPRTRSSIIEAFFRATFESWRNYRKSGKETTWLGYSPVLGVDAEKIFADFPDAHIIHVVRNPYSAYADTKRRPFPLSLYRYIWTWNIVQHMALVFARRFPTKFHILRYEDLISDPESQLSALSQKLGLSFSDSLLYPSWNGAKLSSIYPWGTIEEPTSEANMARRDELSEGERSEIRSLASVMLEVLGYEDL